MNLQSVTQILSGVPIDWIVIASVAILLVCYSMLRGTTIATALAVSLPAAVTIFAWAQGAFVLGATLKQFNNNLAEALVFLVIEAIVLILCIRIVMVFAESHSSVAGIIAGIAATVILVCVWIQVPALASLWHFSPKTQGLFGSLYAFWWLLLAYVGVAFARS